MARLIEEGAVFFSSFLFSLFSFFKRREGGGLMMRRREG